jgi:hypothetical protein
LKSKLASVLATLAIVSVASPVRAQDPGAAETLFQEGRRMMEAGRYAEACPKFQVSLKLAAGLGTELNLADCYEKNGQTATAYATFLDVMALAQKANRPDRERVARERAKQLEARVPKVVVNLEEHSPGIVVKRDGQVLEASSFGTPVPIDPGRHSLEASAPGKRTWTSELDVPFRGETMTVKIPGLEAPGATAKEARPAASSSAPAAAQAANAGPKADEVPAGAAAKPASRDGHLGTNPQRPIGIITAGAGVAGVGVGVALGLLAKSKLDQASANCVAGMCNGKGFDLTQQAGSIADLSTIAFVGGGLALATGIVLYFTAPTVKKESPGAAPENVTAIRIAPVVVPGGGYATVGGAF